MSAGEDVLATDVLVIGGGLAGNWAAAAAAQAGARVVLAEKGYAGTSGVAATAGPGHWWVPPDPHLRTAAIARRAETALGLGDTRWMGRVLDTTWNTLPGLAPFYDFPSNSAGVVQYRGLRGPEYLRALRQASEAAGVRILDHAPALHLLQHDDGSAAGAVLWRRRAKRNLIVRAAAVVLATGGCAFGSHLLGAGNLTGDGLLMAVEAGADLSGMEFTGYYTVAPAHTSMTRSMSYAYATYFDAAGHELAIGAGPTSTRALAAALLDGPVYCHLGRMPADIRALLRRVSPNVPLVFDRLGIDPFQDRFEVTLRGEGTVRGTGGIRVVDDACQTRVPRLFAIGDTATREPVAGATSGGGAQNSAWALSSGVWAGRAAAALAARDHGWSAMPAQQAGPTHRPATASAGDIAARVRDEMLDYDRNLFRTAGKLRRSLDVLDELWDAARGGMDGDPAAARSAAALVASGRWSWSAALARTESRGLHQRLDQPASDPRQAHRLIISGLDRISTSPERSGVLQEQTA